MFWAQRDATTKTQENQQWKVFSAIMNYVLEHDLEEQDVNSSLGKNGWRGEACRYIWLWYFAKGTCLKAAGSVNSALISA